MIVVAITGGIATGKSFCLNVFKERGFVTIDADDISHIIANEDNTRKKITEAFGIDFYKNGELDRKALGNLVFSDEKKLDTLNSIMHKLIYDRIFNIIEHHKSTKDLIAIEIPLLYETNMQGIADYVINCYLPQDIQIQRLMSRNNITMEEASARIVSQMPTEQKKKLADFNLDSRLNFNDTRICVNKIIDDILKKENNE